MTHAMFRLRFLLFSVVFILLFSSFMPSVQAAEPNESLYPVYAGPSEYTISVHTVSDGESVAVLSIINDSWSQIRTISGSIGYCKNSLLQITYTEDDNMTKRVKTNQLSKLFSKPDQSASVAAVLPANMQLIKISEDENGYTQVELPTGKIGYLFSDTLLPDPISTATIKPVPELIAHTGITTEAAAKERLLELSEFFTAGRYWNDFEANSNVKNNNSFCMSDTPCQHENSGYSHCNFYTSPISAALGYSYGSQCVGYTGLISDLIFGTEAPITVHDDFEQLRVGDHIRLVLWDHSMLVTDVGKDENGKTYVYVTEVNADYETCRIDWGRKFTQDDLRRLGDYIEVHSRYPITN